MKTTFCSLVLGLGLGLAGSAHAQQVPSLINFQGKLLDLSNNPRNGSYNLTFRIFSVASGGSSLWSETQNGVSVSNGVFSVQLGAATAIPASVFSSSPTYLEIQVGSEVGSPRQQLVSSPYAFTAQTANSLVPGNTNYIQVTSSLQSGATFYVSSGTVGGPLTIGGQITAGTGANLITTAAGLLDATKLSGALPSAQLSGTYSNVLTLSNPANSLAGDGTNIANVTAARLAPGDTNYVQVTSRLQSGATFYVSSATVGGPFTATGTVALGGAAGLNDVTVKSNLTVNNNLTVNGAGPQILGGNVQVNGNNIADSGGTSRITLGATNLVNGNVSVPSGQMGLQLSTSVFLTGAANSNNYVAFPFTASTNINVGDAVIISGANTVGTVAATASVAAIGFAVTSASPGATVYVATAGIITTATSGGVINAGNRVCTSASAAGQVQACTTNGAPVGKALTGTSGAAQTLSVVIWNGN